MANRANNQNPPQASDGFTRAILAGGDGIRRYERRRRRARLLAVSAAAVALLALGLNAALRRLNAPKPDNTVLSVNPDSVVSNEEKAERQAAPGATEAPEAADYPQEDGILLATGRTRLDQEPPFAPGEWLELCSEGGEMNYGWRYVYFYERPDAEARMAEALEGMWVQYVEDAGNGFAKVRFEGLEGYAETRYLAHAAQMPPPAQTGDLEILVAEVLITDGLGTAKMEQIFYKDQLECFALKKLLEGLAQVDPSECDDEPFGALLHLVLWDPAHREYHEDGSLKVTDLRYNLTRDGGLLLMNGDGTIWAGRAGDASLFWSVFPEAKAATWE